MLDFHKLIDISYLLDPHPSYNFLFLFPLVVVFSLLLTGGIALSLIRPLRAYIWSGQIGQWARWFGFTGLLLLFFRYQGLIYLSTRIYFYFLLFGFLAWLVYILRHLKSIRPMSSEQTIRQESYDKYLPRPKRKRV